MKFELLILNCLKVVMKKPFGGADSTPPGLDRINAVLYIEY